MANTLLTSDEITFEAQRVLHNTGNYIGNVNKEFDKSFGVAGAKIGSQLRIRMPLQFTVREGRTANPQSITEQNETLIMSKYRGVDFEFYDDELKLSMDDFSRRYIKPAISVLAAYIENDALSMVKDVYNSVGTPGTDPNALTPYLSARTKLNQCLAPKNDRFVVINSAAMAATVNALSTLYNPQQKITGQYLDGFILKTAGLTFFENEMIPVLTCGSRDNTTPLTNAATAQSGSSLVCDGFDATATIKQGDIFTIADVYAVHPETKVAYSHLQQFVVTADATCVGGEVTLAISPSIVATGAYQNVSAAAANNKALVFTGTASTAYPLNIAFQKEAFTFVTADLELPKGMDMASRVTKDDISIRFLRGYDIKEAQYITRFDVLYGYKTVRPQLACRIWGA